MQGEVGVGYYECMDNMSACSDFVAETLRKKRAHEHFKINTSAMILWRNELRPIITSGG